MLLDIFLYILLPISCLIFGIGFLVKKKWMHLGRALIMAVGGLAALVLFVYSALMLMINVDQNFYLTSIAVLEVLLLVLLGCGLWGALKKKYIYIPLIVLLVLCVGITCGFTAYRRYQNSVPTVAEGDDLLQQYHPHLPNSKVAKPDAPASLELNGDIPRLDGATALYPVYAAFANAVFPAEEINTSLSCNTTAGAYDAIVFGDVDIIFVAAPSDQQQKFAKEEGVELIYTPIGREAFVFFVNSKNPLEDISLEQIQGIYSGDITRWKELGVQGLGSIRAFQREDGSGSQSALQRLMGDIPLIDPPRENVIAGMGGIISKTADYRNYKNALGYTFRFYATEMVQNDQIKLVSVNGVAPTLENIENGCYPIASEFYAVTRSDASENTKKLLEWIIGPEGQQLIEKTGYTPLN